MIKVESSCANLSPAIQPAEQIPAEKKGCPEFDAFTLKKSP